jgi:hypothetical protein
MRNSYMHKKIVLVLALLAGICTVNAQSDASSLDKSPLDMSYYPGDYPILKIQEKISGPPVARVIYSRPQKKGRVLFGDLVQYGQVWRLGANEATEIEFFQDVKIDDKKVKKGRYTLYALVDTGAWTLILNKETDTWGAFRYDMSKDILRTTVPVQRLPAITENLSMAFEKAKEGAGLVIDWDNIRVEMPFSW